MKRQHDIYGTLCVTSEVAEEMQRQVELWGVQEHPNGTGDKEFVLGLKETREVIEEAEEGDQLTWSMILAEEFLEAMAETDPEKLRTELIQVAAVAATWVQALDRAKERKEFKDSKQLSLFAGWEK